MQLYTTCWLYIASFVSYNSYRDCWKTLQDVYVVVIAHYRGLQAGKIQYEAKAKQRPSNCILPEARGNML